jgi:YHS domain-containing protein
MEVDPCTSEMTAEYEDEIFHFCAQGCLRTFEKNPVKYKNGNIPKRKGIWYVVQHSWMNLMMGLKRSGSGFQPRFVGCAFNQREAFPSNKI